MRRVLAITLLALSLGMGGCGPLPGTAPSLDGTAWTAVLVAGRQPVPGREPGLKFTEGTVVGSDGCNAIEGKVVIEGARVSFTELGGTDVACETNVADIAGLFSVALDRAESIRTDGSNLVIGGPGGEIVLVAAPLVEQ